MKMPVMRGSLRPSSDGSIKGFMIILTVIGFLFFIYYKLKLSPSCSEYLSEIQGNRVEISRLNVLVKTFQDQIHQQEAEYNKMVSQQDTNSLRLDEARMSDSDKMKEIDYLKTELKIANEKLETCGPVASLDDSCLSIEAKYMKRIKELESIIKRIYKPQQQHNDPIGPEDTIVSKIVSMSDKFIRRKSDRFPDERKHNGNDEPFQNSEIEDDNAASVTVGFISKKHLDDNSKHKVERKVDSDDTLKYKKMLDVDNSFKENKVGSNSRNNILQPSTQTNMKMGTIIKMKQGDNFKIFKEITLKHPYYVKQNMQQDEQKYIMKNDFDKGMKSDNVDFDLGSKLKSDLVPNLKSGSQLESNIDTKAELKNDSQLIKLDKNEIKTDVDEEQNDVDEQNIMKGTDNLDLHRNQIDPENEVNKGHLQRDESR